MSILRNIYENSTHYGDILAIPFFFMGIYYFYSIKIKSIVEYILLIACILGFIIDILFTFKFLNLEDKITMVGLEPTISCV